MLEFLLRQGRNINDVRITLFTSTTSMHALQVLTSLLATLISIYGVRRQLRSIKASRRKKSIPLADERVLVIGASSGVGREIALSYARRGARVAIVGRQAENLQRVLEECVAAVPRSASTADADFLEDKVQQNGDLGSGKFWGFTPLGSSQYEVRYFSVVADCSDPKDATRVRTTVEESKLCFVH